MNQKIASILEKASKEKSRGNYSKALNRTTAAIEEYPQELELYKEAIGLGLEAGEPLQTIKYFKKALIRFASEKNELYEFATVLEKRTCDPVFGKYLLEQSIKNKNLQEGFRIVQTIHKHTLEDLLLRTRKKRDTLSSALRGGHNLDDELAINEVSEAILTLALGNIREAAQIFIHHMDAKTYEFDLFEPLLTDLEIMYPKNGYIRYALGSCYLLNNEIDKGIQKIVRAVRLNPELVDDITHRLEQASSKDSPSRDSLEVALLEAYSLQGNTSKVSNLAQSILDASPEKSIHVLNLINKYLDRGTSNWELEEFYLDASLRSNQTKRIRSYLQKTWQQKDKRRNNLDWLEAQSESGSLPPDLQVHFGKLVMEEGRADWAINIFRRAAASSPSEVQNIIYLLGEKKHSEPVIEDFREELKSASQESTSDGSFDIQCFDRSEFSLSSFDQDGDSEHFEVEDNIYDAGSNHTTLESEIPSLDNTNLADLADQEPQSSQEPQPATSSGANQRHEQQINEAKCDPPEVCEQIRMESDHASIPDIATADSVTSHQKNPYGKMDNDVILDQIDAAIDQGRFDEAKSLLDFRPVTIREEVKRILRLADYYYCSDQPLSALIALKSFDPNALNRQEKRDYMIKMATCYRALKQFEAAHCVLINLMNDEPSDTQLVSLAKANYEDYLRERCEGALILEKVCSPNS
jgi:thioredoxin-like negative regulator of GroEL